MPKFAPVFVKDGDQYIVPNPALVFDSSDEAEHGGVAAGLQNGYGLIPNGDVVSVNDNGEYAGPFIITAVGNIRALIVGGPTLDRLTDQNHPAVENLTPPEPPKTKAVDTQKLSPSSKTAAPSTAAPAPTPSPVRLSGSADGE